MRYHIYLSLAILLTGCTPEKQNTSSGTLSAGTDSLEAVREETQRKENTPGADTISFETAFAHFMAALQASDTFRINQFLHPAHGLWVIEQPGALPKMTHVTDIRAFQREFQDRSFFTVADEVRACNLKEEVWPAFDCAAMEGGRSGYSKDGCFVWSPGKFQQSGYWNYASLSDSQLQRIKNALPLLQKSVLHTPTSFEFHFGFADGHWRLLFAKLIYPCSA